MGVLKTGKPDVSPDLPSHTEGVPQGNAKGNYEKMDGHLPDGRGARPARADRPAHAQPVASVGR